MVGILGNIVGKILHKFQRMSIKTGLSGGAVRIVLAHFECHVP